MSSRRSTSNRGSRRFKGESGHRHDPTAYVRAMVDQQYLSERMKEECSGPVHFLTPDDYIAEQITTVIENILTAGDSHEKNY